MQGDINKLSDRLKEPGLQGHALPWLYTTVMPNAQVHAGTDKYE